MLSVAYGQNSFKYMYVYIYIYIYILTISSFDFYRNWRDQKFQIISSKMRGQRQSHRTNGYYCQFEIIKPHTHTSGTPVDPYMHWYSLLATLLIKQLSKMYKNTSHRSWECAGKGWGEAPRKWTCDHNGSIALVPDLVTGFLLTNHDLAHWSVLKPS